MSQWLKDLVAINGGKNLDLHAKYINPQFTKVLRTIGFDFSFEKSNGPYLYDLEGNQYVDFLSGYGVYALGRNHPALKETIKELLDLDLANLVQMEAPLLSGLLAKELIETINQPRIQKVFFTNSGTEAIEAAIKFARAFTGKPRILNLKKSFHGLTTGSLSLNGGLEFKEGFGELLPNTNITQNNLEELESEIAKGDVAAFIFEPIQGKGVFIPDDDFLPEAQKICRKYNTLFIADEVQTGIGRTGKFLASNHWNLEPDMILLSKALSGGYIPVGACLYSDAIYAKVFSRMDRCVVHSSTFGQNNLAMAAGLATLKTIKNENLIENAAKVGYYLMEKLNKLAAQSEWLLGVRGKGLMIGIEFGQPQSLRNKLKWNMVHKMDKGLFAELIVIPLMKKHHFLTQVSGHHQDIIKIIPPLIIDNALADAFVNGLEDVLNECENISGPIWNLGKSIMKQAIAAKRFSA